MKTTEQPQVSPRHELELANARGTHYNIIMAVTFIGHIALLFLNLMFVPDLGGGPRLAIAVIVVALTAYGALGGKAALDDIKAMLDEHLLRDSSGPFAQNMARQPYPLFITLTVVLLLTGGLAQLHLLTTP